MYVCAGAGVGLVGTASTYKYIFIYAMLLFLLTFSRVCQKCNRLTYKRIMSLDLCAKWVSYIVVGRGGVVGSL